MANSVDSVTDEMVNVAHVLADHRRLRRWFMALAALSPEQRNAAFTDMANKMKARRESPAVVAAISLLASTDVYVGVRRAVDELVSARRPQMIVRVRLRVLLFLLGGIVVVILFVCRERWGNQRNYVAVRLARSISADTRFTGVAVQLKDGSLVVWAPDSLPAPDRAALQKIVSEQPTSSDAKIEYYVPNLGAVPTPTP